jgi:PHP domain
MVEPFNTFGKHAGILIDIYSPWATVASIDWSVNQITGRKTKHLPAAFLTGAGYVMRGSGRLFNHILGDPDRRAAFAWKGAVLVERMLLKGCLHTHTTCSDGKMTPQEVADAYRDRGYDFIAFTDHDYLIKPRSYEIYRAVRSDLIIFVGIELTVFVKGYIHVSRITGESEQLHIFNHLGEYDLTIGQVMDRIREVSSMYPLDAVEITSKGFRNCEYEIDEIPYPKIASDDSHTSVGIGRAWIEMDAERKRDSIIRAVKRGEFWNCFL